MKKFREYVVVKNGSHIVYGSYGRKGSVENILDALNAIKLSLGIVAYHDALYNCNYKIYLHKEY